MDADRPFTRQYDVFMGGLNGVPAALLPMSVMQTNENYIIPHGFPFAMLFSRGGFLTDDAQAGRREKTLMAVFLRPLKVCAHPAGIGGGDLRRLLEDEEYLCAGNMVQLRWGHTFSVQMVFAGQRVRVLTLRAELCASVDVAEDGGAADLVPEAPDSPPPLHRAARFEPVNFYEI